MGAGYNMFTVLVIWAGSVHLSIFFQPTFILISHFRDSYKNNVHYKNQSSVFSNKKKLNNDLIWYSKKHYQADEARHSAVSGCTSFVTYSLILDICFIFKVQTDMEKCQLTAWDKSSSELKGKPKQNYKSLRRNIHCPKGSKSSEVEA